MKSSFFLVIVLLQYLICLSFLGGASAANLEEICRKASSSINVTYDFCLTSLQPIHGTREVDTKGLASITINLSISNFTIAREKIADLQTNATADQRVKDALQICAVRFRNGDASLMIAQTDLGLNHIQDALSSVRAAAGSAVVCANAFYERGIQSPLTSADTQNGFLLCNLAAYIIQLLA